MPTPLTETVARSGRRPLLHWITASTFALAAACSGSAFADEDDADAEAQVRAVIYGLQESWNAGNMDAYLNAYSRGPEMSLTFGNTVVQNWEALHSLFTRSYPDPVRMGQFTVDSLSVTLLDDDAAIAYGAFTHVFPTETILGGYTHVLVRTEDDDWLIVHERTSRAEVLHNE